MYFLFLACSQQSSFILLEEYAREHQLPPPTSLQSNIHILTLENGWKISVQYHPTRTQNEVTLHGGLYLSNATSSTQAAQLITKMMTWNYEMSGAYFSINPQSSVVLLSTWVHQESLSKESLVARLVYLQEQGTLRFPILEQLLYDREP